MISVELNKQTKADLLLLLSTSFWGMSYFLTNICLEEMPPMGLNAFRFLAAFIVLGSIYYKKLIRISQKTLQYSLLVGLALTGTYIF